MLCVKLWDVESAGQHIRPLIGPDTAVIPLQNGIDAAERLIPILSRSTPSQVSRRPAAQPQEGSHPKAIEVPQAHPAVDP